MNRRDRRSRAPDQDTAARAEALFRAATEHHRAGRLDAAGAAYRDTLRLVPDSANVHGMLATCLHDGGDRAAAGTHFRRAADLAPGDAAHQRNLGMWLVDSGDKPAAVAAFRHAVANAPEDTELRRTLGTLLADLGRYDEAAPQLRRVIERAPGDVAALRALALVRRDTGDLRGAEDMMRPLLDLPDPPPGLYTDFAALLRDTDRDDEATGLLDACLAKYPDYREARFHRGMIRLRRRAFADGWADYARGLRPTDPSPDFSTDPVAADLTGLRVRIDRDQGLGDEVFFLRFAPEIARRGARIVYRGDARLTAMFARLDFLAEIMAIGADAGACDIAWCASHLPHLLGTTEPQPSVRIPADPRRAAEIAARLDALGPAPRIGVTWRAGTQQRDRLSKLAPQDGIADALAGLPATLIALQRNPRPGEIEALSERAGNRLHDLTALNDDLEDMLALTGLLDDYVAVSNTNVHLRAAQGRASRVLVPFPAEFRWTVGDGPSPWFPDSAAYREHYREGWAPAIRDLARDLSTAWKP